MLYIPARDTYTAPNAHRYLALDSNMFNGFKRYVLDGERGTEHIIGMEQLIAYRVVHRYSVMPTPYLLEIIADRGFDAAKPYCEEIVEAVLRLQYMDGAHFPVLSTVLFLGHGARQPGLRYGTRSFQVAAKKRTEEILGWQDSDTRPLFHIISHRFGADRDRFGVWRSRYANRGIRPVAFSASRRPFSALHASWHAFSTMTK